MNLEQVVKVGMADLNISAEPASILRTSGLGSCVGVTLYDPIKHIGGLAHIMLPSSEISGASPVQPGKYADTAIPELIKRMEAVGAGAGRLIAKMAGGAQMFAFGGQDTMRIGPRNAESCKRMLDEFAIPVHAADTGGNYGRTIELDCMTGILTVRSVQYGVKEL